MPAVSTLKRRMWSSSSWQPTVVAACTLLLAHEACVPCKLRRPEKAFDTWKEAYSKGASKYQRWKARQVKRSLKSQPGEHSGLGKGFAAGGCGSSPMSHSNSLCAIVMLLHICLQNRTVNILLLVKVVGWANQ